MGSFHETMVSFGIYTITKVGRRRFTGNSRLSKDFYKPEHWNPLWTTRLGVKGADILYSDALSPPGHTGSSDYPCTLRLSVGRTGDPCSTLWNPSVRGRDSESKEGTFCLTPGVGQTVGRTRRPSHPLSGPSPNKTLRYLI